LTTPTDIYSYYNLSSFRDENAEFNARSLKEVHNMCDENY